MLNKNIWLNSHIRVRNIHIYFYKGKLKHGITAVKKLRGQFHENWSVGLV